jgi:uncharacterized protein DUF4410
MKAELRNGAGTEGPDGESVVVELTEATSQRLVELPDAAAEANIKQYLRSNLSSRARAQRSRRIARPSRRLSRITLVFSLLFICGCGNVQVKAHSPSGSGPLQPTLEDRDAGLVGVASGFDLKKYRIIGVEPFAVTARELDGDDKTLAQMVPDYLRAELVRRLRATGIFDQVVDLHETPLPSEPGPILKLGGEVTALTGGSRHLRFWIGFGAGRSKFEAATRLVDATSGQVVLVTVDRRVAAMSDAMSLDYGGDDEQLIKEAMNDIARDFAKFMVRLSRGEGSAPR